MNGHRFEKMLCSFVASRRSLLSGTLAVPAGWLGIAGIDAKKKRKKRSKLKRNSFGCVDVGNACRGNSGNCCSGICAGKTPKRGKKDKSTCLAHNVLDCQAGSDGCLESGVRCGIDGVCAQTTGKASFCGDLSTGECVSCARDTDCEPTFGAGAACTLCAGACPETGGRTCRAAAI